MIKWHDVNGTTVLRQSVTDDCATLRFILQIVNLVENYNTEWSNINDYKLKLTYWNSAHQCSWSALKYFTLKFRISCFLIVPNKSEMPGGTLLRPRSAFKCYNIMYLWLPHIILFSQINILYLNCNLTRSTRNGTCDYKLLKQRWQVRFQSC